MCTSHFMLFLLTQGGEGWGGGLVWLFLDSAYVWAVGKQREHPRRTQPIHQTHTQHARSHSWAKGIKKVSCLHTFPVNYVINLWCLWNVLFLFVRVVWGNFSFCRQVSFNRPRACSSKDKNVCDVTSVIFPTTASVLAFLKDVPVTSILAHNGSLQARFTNTGLGPWAQIFTLRVQRLTFWEQNEN